jgi:hypothetical protein
MWINLVERRSRSDQILETALSDQHLHQHSYEDKTLRRLRICVWPAQNVPSRDLNAAAQPRSVAHSHLCTVQNPGRNDGPGTENRRPCCNPRRSCGRAARCGLLMLHRNATEICFGSRSPVHCPEVAEMSAGGRPAA